VKTLSKNNQKGFSLVIALLLVAAFTGVLTSLVIGRKSETIRQAADIAGWEAAMLGKAARVYVRDLMIADPNLVNILDIINVGPTDIPIQTLIDMALLPHDFANEISPGEFVNGLKQPMRVIMANFPINGDPADPTTVPTAYIYFEDNQRSNAALMQDVVQAARREGVAVSSPVFSGSNNISGMCNGLGDSVIIWDTGCMSDIEFQALAGAEFAAGSFVLPAWRSVKFDSRAIMRYAQPENPGAQTMLVSLEMAEMKDCSDDSITANFAQIIKDNPDAADGYEMTASNLCGAENDNSLTLENKRHDLIGVRDVQANSLLIDRQDVDDVRIDNNGFDIAVADADEDFNLDGNLTVTGDARTYEGDIIVTGDITADRNIFVSGDSAGVTASASIGDLNTGGLTINDGVTILNNADIAGDINVSDTTEVSGEAQTDGSFFANSIAVSNNSGITINDRAEFYGQTSADTVSVTGGAGTYSTIIENATLGTLDVDGNATIASAIEFNGNTTISDSGRLSVSNSSGDARCIGDFCPKRMEQDICREQTSLDYHECMEQTTRNTYNPLYRE